MHSGDTDQGLVFAKELVLTWFAIPAGFSAGLVVTWLVVKLARAAITVAAERLAAAKTTIAAARCGIFAHFPLFQDFDIKAITANLALMAPNG